MNAKGIKLNWMMFYMNLKTKIFISKIRLELKTPEEVIDLLKNKAELRDFVHAMESAIYEATKPRRFFDIRELSLEPRQIEPEIPFTPRPGIDFQT